MNHNKQRMIEERANPIGYQQDNPPWAILHEIGQRNHSPHQANNGKQGQWVFTHQFLYFRILLQDLQRTDAMRLRTGRMMKRCGWHDSGEQERIIDNLTSINQQVTKWVIEFQGG